MKSISILKEVALSSLAPIKKLSVSEWADKFRQLPSTSAEPGQWHTRRVPYARAIMDAFTEPRVKKIVAMTSAQVSKTECALNVIGRYVHLDPCNIMLIEPTLEMAQDISKDRLSKMIADSKVLTPLFFESKTRDANQTILSKNFQGGRLVLAGANSAAGLASRPIRILLCDEVDRFPNAILNEGDPVKLATARTTTYWNSKIGLFSTPTVKGASRIELEYLSGTQEQWQHACPNCGEFHKLDFRDFKISEEPLWQCPDCGFEFTEQEIKSAPQKYVQQNFEATGEVRSFWVNAFSSPWLSWKQILHEWQEAKGDASLEKVIYNTRFGESYEPRAQSGDEQELLNRRENYNAELAQNVLILTAAVDVQANRLEFEIVGWGENFLSWGIQRGVILGTPNLPGTWAQLDAVLDREFSFKSGRKLKIARTFIDSGFSTQIVYNYCAENILKGRYAIKGRGSPGLPLICQYSSVRGFPIQLVTLGVIDGKQAVLARLASGEMHFPLDDEFINRRGYDEVYFKQLLSERQVIKRTSGVSYLTFEPLTKSTRNESFDLAVYNLAAIKSLNPDWAKLFADVHGAAQDSPIRKVLRERTRRIMTRNFDIF